MIDKRMKQRKIGTNQRELLDHFWKNPNKSKVVCISTYAVLGSLKKRGLVVSYELFTPPNDVRRVRVVIDRSVDAYIELNYSKIMEWFKGSSQPLPVNASQCVVKFRALLSEFWCERMHRVGVVFDGRRVK